MCKAGWMEAFWMHARLPGQPTDRTPHGVAAPCHRPPPHPWGAAQFLDHPLAPCQQHYVRPLYLFTCALYHLLCSALLYYHHCCSVVLLPRTLRPLSERSAARSTA